MSHNFRKFKFFDGFKVLLMNWKTITYFGVMFLSLKIPRGGICMNQPFEFWYQEKLHLVYGAMKQLHIQGNTEEFYQIGLVALWEASLRYEEGKGEFDSYVYSYILSRMKTALTRMTNYQQRICVTEDQYLDIYESGSYETKVMDELIMEAYLKYLTKNQQDVIRERYVSDLSVEETATLFGISVSAIKNRTRDAIHKLGKVLNG